MLPVVAAKHRLAYTLTRAAQLDCERGRHDAESRRAQEALEYASLLHRVTEMALASAILACTSRANNEPEAAAQHDASMAALEADGVAVWAAEYYRQDAAEKRAVQK